MSTASTPYFFYLLFIATIGPFLFGYHLGELNAPQDVITCRKKSIGTFIDSSLPQCILMSKLQFGSIQSVFTVGGLLGALSAGPVSSSRGRLFTMRVNSAFQITGPLLEALAPSVPVFILGRFLSGVGAGASLVAVPIYISEIAPPDKRGFYGAFTQIMTNGGILVTQLLGYFLSYGRMWRLILAIAGMVALVQLIALMGAKESPRWLIDHNRGKEGRDILQQLRGMNVDIEDEIKSWKSKDSPDDSDSERQNLLSSDSREADDGASDHTFFSVIRDPYYRPAILAILLVMGAQQLTGINSIVMYGVSILSTLFPTSSALLNVFVSLINVVLTTLFAPLVDIWGRKRCLLLSIAGMSTSSLLLAIALKTGITILSAICVLTFVASFAIGLGPVPFMLASELVDARGVSATQSWALSGNWIATFIVAQFFPIVNDALGKGGVYFLFAALGLLFFTSIGWVVPETMGKKDMAEVWGMEGSESHRD